MKIISIILSLILLGANLVPCSDLAISKQSKQQAKVLLAEQDHEHDGNHSNPLDFCSPFCSCHYCHTHFTPESQVALDWIVEIVSQTPSSFYTFYFPNPTFSFWQPPKIA